MNTKWLFKIADDEYFKDFWINSRDSKGYDLYKEKVTRGGYCFAVLKKQNGEKFIYLDKFRELCLIENQYNAASKNSSPVILYGNVLLSEDGKIIDIGCRDVWGLERYYENTIEFAFSEILFINEVVLYDYFRSKQNPCSCEIRSDVTQGGI